MAKTGDVFFVIAVAKGFGSSLPAVFTHSFAFPLVVAKRISVQIGPFCAAADRGSRGMSQARSDSVGGGASDVVVVVVVPLALHTLTTLALHISHHR